jgi:hypothetical protein
MALLDAIDAAPSLPFYLIIGALLVLVGVSDRVVARRWER